MMLESDRSRGAGPQIQARSARPEARGKTAAMPAEGFDAQVQFLRPEGDGYEAQAARLRPSTSVVQREEKPGASDDGKKKKSRDVETTGEATLGTDIEIEQVEQWEKDANAKLDELEGTIRKSAHEALGASAPNRVQLGLDISASAAVASAEQKGKEETKSGPSVGAEAKLTGEIGWAVTLQDALILGGLKPDALEVDREFEFGGEKGRVKASPFGEVFVGVKVEGKAGIKGAAEVGGVLNALAGFLGTKGGEAAKGTSKTAGSDLEAKAADKSTPVPKIGKKGAGESGPKSDAPSSVVAAEGSLSGKAFAGAEITVGGKAALAWKKKKPDEYAGAIQHYLEFALAMNPVTAPFAPAAMAIFRLHPEMLKEIAPTLMGQEGLVDVGSVEASITGQAGAGAEGALEAKFENGRLSFKASGEGTLGFGGGADVKIDVDVLEAVRLGAAVQGGLLQELENAVKAEANALGERAKGVWTQLVIGLAKDVGKLTEFLKECGANAVTMLFQIWDDLVKAGIAVGDLVKAAWNGFTNDVALLWGLVQKAGADALTMVWEAVKESGDKIAFFIGLIMDALSPYASFVLKLLWQESWSLIGSVWGAAGESLRTALFDYVRGKGWREIGELLSFAAGQLSELIALIWGKSAMADLAVVFQYAASQWDALWQVVWEKASMEQLGRMVAQALTSDIPKWVTAIWDKVAGNIDQLVRFVAQLASRFWDFVNAIVPKLSFWDAGRLIGV